MSQDLFFKYTWNNFLHTQVQQCLALAINCGNRDNDIIYNNVSCTPLIEWKTLNNSIAFLDIYQVQINREDLRSMGQKRE